MSAIDKDILLTLTDSIINKDNRVKISTLSDELTISQVVKFFEKQGVAFTKTMIQNYIRVGVLPPPIDKRYYTKNHLVLLTLINSLKSAFSLEEIKAVFAPVRNNPEIFEDDIIRTTDIYRNYLNLRKAALGKWKESMPETFDKIGKLITEDGIPEPEKPKAVSFLLVLTIMAQSIAMRDLANSIIDGYLDGKE